jgi:HEAT repeat protein
VNHALLIVASLGLGMGEGEEPIAKGKPLSYWIAVLKQERGNPFQKVWAERAIASLGPRAKDAVPRLLRELDTAEGGARASILSTLGKIGSVASSATPRLLRALTDPSDYIRSEAAEALGSIGAEPETTIPALIALLDDKDLGVRASAAKGLGQFGTRSRAAIPKLVTMMGPSNYGPLPDVVTSALIRIAPDPTALMLERFDIDRTSAIQGLKELGPKANAAIPTLMREATSDAPDHLHGTAALALSAIAPNDPEVVRAVLKATRAPHKYSRGEAIQALAIHRQHGRAAVPRLIEIVTDDEDGSCVNLAIQVIQIFAAHATPAVPAVRAALRHPDREGRSAAARALATIDVGNADTIGALLSASKDADLGVRMQVLMVLTLADPKGSTVLPTLLTALKDPDPRIREVVAQALGRLGPKAEPAIPALLAALKVPQGVHDDPSSSPR